MTWIQSEPNRTSLIPKVWNVSWDMNELNSFQRKSAESQTNQAGMNIVILLKLPFCHRHVAKNSNEIQRVSIC